MYKYRETGMTGGASNKSTDNVKSRETGLTGGYLGGNNSNK